MNMIFFTLLGFAFIFVCTRGFSLNPSARNVGKIGIICQRGGSALFSTLHARPIISKNRIGLIYSGNNETEAATNVAEIKDSSHFKLANPHEEYSTQEMVSPMNLQTVPSLEAIATAAKRVQESAQSNSFSKKTGGYPSQVVQDSIYLNVWALLKHQSNIDEKKRELQQRIRESSANLETFGLR